jgi:hypothetical protein
VILNTKDYKHKINTLLEDAAYRRLNKDPTTGTERKTVILLKKSTLPEDVRKKLTPSTPEYQDCTDYPKYTRKGSHSDPLLVT